MRSLWILMLSLNVIGMTAAAEFRGTLLTYSQLDHLAPAKRMAYIEELRELIILLEKKDNDLIAAGEVSSLKDQVADLLEIFSSMPAAQAAGFNSRIHPPVKTETPSTTNSTTVAPTSPAAPAAASAPAPACVQPSFDCTKLTPAQRTEAETKFRNNKDPGANVCISGGFFSRYPYAKSRGGKCEVVRTYPPPPAKAIIPSCPPGQALCNPIVFCLGAMVPNPESPAKSDFKPLTKCVKYGRQDGYDITKRCDDWYNHLKDHLVKKDGQLAEPNLPADQTKTAIACDPNNTSLIAVTEIWNLLRKNFETYYNVRCQGDNDFKAMFCTECNVMAKHVFHMNDKATGSGCVAAPGPATPSSAPGAAPAPASSGDTPAALPEPNPNKVETQEI